MLVNILEPNFIFKDDRGELVQLVREGYKQVNYIFAKQGCVRGGHSHQQNVEAFYVISGSFILSLRDKSNNRQEEILFRTGAFFSISQNVSHSFKFTEDTHLISMYDNGVELSNGSKDILSD